MLVCLRCSELALIPIQPPHPHSNGFLPLISTLLTNLQGLAMQLLIVRPQSYLLVFTQCLKQYSA